MTPKIKLVTVAVTLVFALPEGADADSYGVDGANELLREHQRSFAPSSCLLDYALGERQAVDLHQAHDYEEGDAFTNRAVAVHDEAANQTELPLFVVFEWVYPDEDGGCVPAYIDPATGAISLLKEAPANLSHSAVRTRIWFDSEACNAQDKLPHSAGDGQDFPVALMGQTWMVESEDLSDMLGQRTTPVVTSLQPNDELVQAVVDEVLARAKKFGFRPEGPMVAESIQESATLLSIELSAEQVSQAGQRISSRLG